MPPPGINIHALPFDRTKEANNRGVRKLTQAPLDVGGKKIPFFIPCIVGSYTVP